MVNNPALGFGVLRRSSKIVRIVGGGLIRFSARLECTLA
jgi:hypothetical protein